MAENWFADAWANPKFKQFLSEAGQDLGYGLSNSTNLGNAFGAATRRSAEMQPTRDLAQKTAEQEDKRVAQINATAEFLRSKGAEDLAAAVEGGFTTGSAAFNQWYEQANAGPKAPIEVGGVLVDPVSFQPVFDSRQPEKPPAAPSGYQWAEGGLAPIPGGPADKPAGSTPMPATTQRELFEAEDAVNAGGYVMSALDSAIELNKTAADGAWAGQRATIGANIPDIGVLNGDQTDQATIQYQNIVNELALNQLKTIFGAAPTEGERKILLEIQGSVEQPRAVREQILQRARVMAERRIADAKAKADGLRTGQYFQPGYGQQPASNGPRTTQSGVTYQVDQ